MNNCYQLYEVIRNENKCIKCKVCVSQCSNKVHILNEKDNQIVIDDSKCVNCLRCVVFCPTNALKVIKYRNEPNSDNTWTNKIVSEISKQADTGGVLLSSMGSDKDYPVYFDRIVINASQVTNPSIDPLREPMETIVHLGKKSHEIKRDSNGKIITKTNPQLKINLPIIFSAMSYGAISYNAHVALLNAAQKIGTFYNSGEGGLHEDFYPYKDNIIVQVASGRFGVNKTLFDNASAIEIKIGQGAKPGIGGHLPGKKVTEDVSKTRNIPVGVSAISPAPHHDIYSIEDLSQLIYSLKEVTGYKKPIIVKIAAVNNIASIASGIARSGADIIEIDGYRGGTGAAPTRIRDNVGIPIELAIACVDKRLRDEGIRDNVSLIASGGIRSSSDVVKIICLGADAVSIGTASLIAMGCHMCRNCQSGLCNWGIATQNPDLVKRLDITKSTNRLINLLNAWNHEIKEMMGGMGINAIESLRGNRLMLAGVGLSEKELEILGIKHAGEF